MKKVIAISLLLIFVLAGCAGQDNNKQDNINKASKRKILDFERPEERPNISGIVKTIIGNEVTILKIERPDMSGENHGEDENVEERGAERIQRPTSGFGGGMGGGGGMHGGTGTSGMGNVSGRLEILKEMSTGEEKVIIPVGIKMLKNEDKKMVEATLEDVTNDKMLMIWTDATIVDRNIANFVIIN